MREIPILMPKMSMTMQEGTLVVWHRQPGDEVRAGDTVCDVATDKVDMEVESPADGTLTRLVADPDEVVPVGRPIAYLTSTADDLLGDLLDGPDPAAEAASDAGAVPDAEAASDAGAAEEATGPAGPGEAADPVAPPSRPPAVPLARARAAQAGIDLSAVRPTGPYGTIRVADVERVAATPRPARRSTGDRAARRAALRAAVARRLAESPRVPQFTVHADLDVADPAGPWTARLVAAWAAVLRGSPALHATWRDGRVEAAGPVGVAVAVPTATGLLAPVLRDPDLMSLDDLAGEIRRLGEQARSGRLAVANLSGATTTLLDLGGDPGGPVISQAQVPLAPPQSTALAVGGVAPQAVVVDGGIEVRIRCRIGVTVDQRVADPPEAVDALTRLAGVLDGPSAGTGSR